MVIGGGVVQVMEEDHLVDDERNDPVAEDGSFQDVKLAASPTMGSSLSATINPPTQHQQPTTTQRPPCLDDSMEAILDAEYFDAWTGLACLWRHSTGGKQKGLHYVVCERLRDRPIDEIEFVLPQIIHLMMMSEWDSTPLECFLLDTCQISLHASILALWLVENYLADFKSLTDMQSQRRYQRSVRVLQSLQAALWNLKQEPLMDSRPDSSPQSFSDGEGRTPQGIDTLPSVDATLVGFGCILASLTVPSIAPAMMPLALMEARRLESIRNRSSRCSTSTSTTPTTAISPPQTTTRVIKTPPSALSKDETSSSPFSLKEYFKQVNKQVSKQMSKQMRKIAPKSSIFITNHSNASRAEIVLYYQPEMQFVMNLLEVGQRLCLVPSKEGRQQALQAELGLLNQSLPSAICVPLWCHGVDYCPNRQHHHHHHLHHHRSTRWSHHNHERHGTCHHRVLRIPPTESVCLNSAERVPYVIYVEILKDQDEESFQKLISSDGKHPNGNSESPSTPQSPTIRTPHMRSRSIQSHPLPNLTVEESNPTSHIHHTPAARTGSGPVMNLNQPIDNGDFAERMRTAAIMLAQLTRQETQAGSSAAQLADIAAIKARLISEMEALEKSRLLDALQAPDQTYQADLALTPQINDPQSTTALKDDPSAAIFSEGWEDKKARIKKASPFGSLPGWDLLSVVVKAGCDMRQEQLACQLIEEMHDIWNMSGLPIWVAPLRILVAGSGEGGLMETARNAISLHSIKKAALSSRRTVIDESQPPPPFTLRDYYIKTFGSPDSDGFINARDAFMKSLVGYSLVTYILQLRDRHNGNILVDAAGHVIHIDFGFMLAVSPGGGTYYGIESAPFKLTAEYIDLLGGLHSEPFSAFKDLIQQGFMALRRHADRLLLLLEISQKDSNLACFGGAGPSVIAQMRQRLQPGLSEYQVKLFVDRLVTGSAHNLFTRLYDSFQYYSNGIL